MSAPQADLTFQACAKHGIPIERGAACAECVRETQDDLSPSYEVEARQALKLEALEGMVASMLAEACAALGVEPTGWAWRCEGCGEYVSPDRNFGHARAVDEHCGPISIDEQGGEQAAWAAALEAMRARRVASEALGYVIVDVAGTCYRYLDDNCGPHIYSPREREIAADSLCAQLNRGTGPMPAIVGGSEYSARQPFRVVPVGPVQEVRPFGFGVIDKDGAALVQHVYRGGDTAEHSAAVLNQASVRMELPLPDAPFAAVQLFYVSPPDRPAEAGETAKKGGEA